MFKKKYIIIAVGIVSVLMGSFLVNNVLLAQSGGEYDPWIDINEDFTVRVAHNVSESCQLVEAGFDYVTGDYADGGKIFRKRK